MRIVALISIFFTLCFITSRADIKIADVVFKNGNIYTLYDCHPLVEAIGVKDGRIIYVGSNKGVKAHEGKETRVIDLHGSTVVPGLADSHYHLSGVGRREMTL